MGLKGHLILSAFFAVLALGLCYFLHDEARGLVESTEAMEALSPSLATASVRWLTGLSASSAFFLALTAALLVFRGGKLGLTWQTFTLSVCTGVLAYTCAKGLRPLVDYAAFTDQDQAQKFFLPREDQKTTARYELTPQTPAAFVYFDRSNFPAQIRVESLGPNQSDAAAVLTYYDPATGHIVVPTGQLADGMIREAYPSLSKDRKLSPNLPPRQPVPKAIAPSAASLLSPRTPPSGVPEGLTVPTGPGEEGIPIDPNRTMSARITGGTSWVVYGQRLPRKPPDPSLRQLTYAVVVHLVSIDLNNYVSASDQELKNFSNQIHPPEATFSVTCIPYERRWPMAGLHPALIGIAIGVALAALAAFALSRFKQSTL